MQLIMDILRVLKIFYWARTKWRVWKNSDDVTGNVRRHLKKDHTDSSWSTVRKEKFKGCD